MEEKLVSVIMPAYNCEMYISQAIDCILKQTYKNIELLIADDYSTDRTKKIIEKYAAEDSRVKLFHNETNMGYLLTWNKLMALSTGQYITFQDADDYSELDRVQKIADVLQNNKEYSICGSAISIVGANNEFKKVKSYPANPITIRESLLQPYAFPFCGSAVMITRQVYEEAGVYRPFFNRLGWEDHDWLIRCCLKFKATNIDAPLYSYRQTEVSVTRSSNPEGYRKSIIKKIGIELAKQRMVTTTDCLERGAMWELYDMIAEYDKPFQLFPSKKYMYAAYQTFNKRQRLHYIAEAIKRSPFHLKYYYHYFKNLI